MIWSFHLVTDEKTGRLSYCTGCLGNFFPKFPSFRTSGINYPTTCRNNPEVLLQQYGKKKWDPPLCTYPSSYFILPNPRLVFQTLCDISSEHSHSVSFKTCNWLNRPICRKWITTMLDKVSHMLHALDVHTACHVLFQTDPQPIRYIHIACLLHAFSSDSSEQSGLSSHIQVSGTHSPRKARHVNSSGLHTFSSGSNITT